MFYGLTYKINAPYIVCTKVPSALASKLKTSKQIRGGAGKEVVSSKKLKADLHSANFSRANGTFPNGECFLFNLHLKSMKFGLIVKPIRSVYLR